SDLRSLEFISKLVKFFPSTLKGFIMLMNLLCISFIDSFGSISKFLICPHKRLIFVSFTLEVHSLVFSNSSHMSLVDLHVQILLKSLSFSPQCNWFIAFSFKSNLFQSSSL